MAPPLLFERSGPMIADRKEGGVRLGGDIFSSTALPRAFCLLRNAGVFSSFVVREGISQTSEGLAIFFRTRTALDDARFTR